ncbi:MULTISPECIES: peptidoglycan DD-metalloendopeptidase family protein [unclassified Sphingopyxis]|uniref:murein hydrolase activator EnvC family protein n=1 Tax=unclassified Sphingopyxis TaxID=2614943 RepID=UPI00073067A8|nr:MULTISPECIES: peptidoglycan DD-metalloendopeptidase family protein [unclassified Sphingopyxis]KTE27812.1 metalloendopeptidase [Sphingopyxis sp. H057]KTE55808.1 metalloendopeptidase [Sphingopyxis sp. H073]KTE57311.1 metalloendopeptidase [Sphingopyxis sp. H071]KTE61397.1 metalloendopeptidase [Sphingopyxis sp. H107]KTE65271.1 metalloendopeptidase [Sphingopyxis sp. H100]
MRRALATLALAVTVAGGALAIAQSDVFDPDAIAANERQQLLTAKQQSAEAMERSAALEAQATAARSEADRLKKRSAALAARIQSAEADINAGEARVALVGQRVAAQEARLAEQRQPLLELTAALQQLSRQPPVSVLAQPGSLADMVHARAVLDAAMPVIAQRTAGVRRELVQLRATKTQQAIALKALAASKTQLAQRRDALTRLENEGRLRSRELMSSAQLEADRALGLGEKARDIVDLMDTLEIDSATRGELAELAGPLPRPRDPTSAAMTAAPPAPAEAELARGAYRLPVVGRIVAGLGEVNESGVRSRGITIAARPGGQVVAPAPGRVSFAGDYRGYGKIVIIDHGGGWTSLVTGMIALSVGVGDTLDAGTPVGRAGSQDSRITIELRRAGRPVDIVAMLG